MNRTEMNRFVTASSSERLQKKENEVNNSRWGKVRAGLLLGILALFITGVGFAQQGDGRLVRFKGAIGVDPVAGAANGAISLNTVRGVSPPGAIWVINDLDADVRTDGRIRVSGHGLLLGAGNSIATNANQSVHATLFCGPAATASAHSTPNTGVALEADGDFTINDVLSPAPPVPCDTPVLLIRNVGGAWFAAGIPKL
jgi:hypothetical protein